MKQPKRITGLEASLLSYRGRHGRTPDHLKELEEQVSTHVRRIVFAKKKGKAGKKTLAEIRKIADANRDSIAALSKKPRNLSLLNPL